MFSAQPTLGLWIDIVQTAVLGVVAYALVYVMLLLRHEVRATAAALNRILTEQAELENRVKALENRDQRSDL
jgi:hypothetical protein